MINHVMHVDFKVQFRVKHRTSSMDAHGSVASLIGPAERTCIPAMRRWVNNASNVNQLKLIFHMRGTEPWWMGHIFSPVPNSVPAELTTEPHLIRDSYTGRGRR